MTGSFARSGKWGREISCDDNPERHELKSELGVRSSAVDDRNLLFGARPESLKTHSVRRLRVSYQQIDSDSGREKPPPFAILCKY